MGILTKTDIASTCDFGSQMSQYAALYALSRKTGHSVAFIEQTLNVRWGLALLEPFIHKPTVISIDTLNDKTFFQINKELIDSKLQSLVPTQNYDVRADLGIYTYFHDIRDDIIKLYTFTPDIANFCKSYISKLRENNELLISMHFRRGDYLQFSSLNLSINYYIEAIQYCINKFTNQSIRFVVFSNDIQWCKENIDGDCIFVENQSRYQDMCLMSMCDHNIIANSSFSWWGAYLNTSPTRNVICPYDYLNHPDYNHLINGKYFPKDWVSINKH
jgi:hypothetical protein